MTRVGLMKELGAREVKWVNICHSLAINHREKQEICADKYGIKPDVRWCCDQTGFQWKRPQEYKHGHLRQVFNKHGGLWYAVTGWICQRKQEAVGSVL